VPGRFRAATEPTGPDTPLAQAAQLRGPPLAFPREGVRDWPHPRCFPSEELPEGLDLAWQAETDPDRPEGEPLSTGCSHPVEKEPSPFLSRPDPALMSREEQDPDTGDDRLDNRIIWTASAASP